MGEEEGVQKIKAQFAAQGYELVVERVGGGYFAPYVPVDTLGPGSAPYGWGRTASEAAEDAWTQFQKRLSDAEAARIITEGGSFWETGDEASPKERPPIAPDDVSRRDEPW